MAESFSVWRVLATRDTAWKKEVSSRVEGTPGWRPEGREPVSDQQIREAQLKRGLDDAQLNVQMASTVSDRLLHARSRHASLTSLSCLSCSQDWKFWVGILAVLSIATALLGHPSPGDQTYAV